MGDFDRYCRRHSGAACTAPCTTDRDTALTWYTTLHHQGIEGIVAKRTTSPYRAGRTGTSWLKRSRAGRTRPWRLVAQA